MRRDEFQPGFRITEHQADAQRDAADEIAFHLAMRQRELMAGGMSEAEARTAALAAFGDVERVRSTLVVLNEGSQRRRGLVRFVESLHGDVRFALRGPRRSPVFTGVAMLTLALGIGANAVIFSLIEATLLRAPGVRQPDRMVSVWTTSRRGEPRASSSYPDYEDYRDRSTRLSDLAAYAAFSVTVGTAQGAELAGAELVTGNYFETLGLRAAAGRLLVATDDVEGGDAAVAVLSHAYWRTRHGGDAAAVGRSVQVNGVSYRIVGVAPREFSGLVLGQVPDLWLPLRGLPALFPATFRTEAFDGRGNRWIPGVAGRLSPGATVEQARAELLRISDQLFAEDSAARGPRRVTVDGLARRIPGTGAAVTPFLTVLQGAVLTTLLLACANLANLLLARATSRRNEMAVRLALGVERRRLLRQLLTESVLLALLGGGLALLVARLALAAVSGVPLPFGIELGSVGAGLNGTVTLFTLGLSVVTGLVFGMVPAWSASRDAAASVLREARAGETRRSARVRSALLGLQLALAVVLLVGAVLFVRTFRNRLRLDVGFPLEGLAMMSIDLSMNAASSARSRPAIDELIRRAAALPGVASASAGVVVPIEGVGMGTFVNIDGYTPTADEELRVEFNAVAPDFLRTLGLPLAAGRDIDASDIAAGRRVVVIDETMARRWWPGRDPLGGVVRFRGPGGPEAFTVIGVVKNSAWGGLEVGESPFLLMPAALMPSAGPYFGGRVTIIARTRGDAAQLLLPMRQVLHDVEPAVAPVRIRTMKQELGAQLAGPRAAAWLMSAFSVLALALATLGIYGVVGYIAAERRRDLSVRMALGARAAQIVRAATAGVWIPCVIGLAAGVAGARALSILTRSFLFGITPSDPMTYFAVAICLGVTAGVACLVPALRATRVPPAVVLKDSG